MIVVAASLPSFLDPNFWIGVGIEAGIYAIFVLGLQLNAGFTGIFNFGQSGFMAIGAYTMGILVVMHGWSFLLALVTATAVAVLCGVLLGLSSLRLRADYFAIVTIAFAEITRYFLLNAREITNGSLDLYGFDTGWLNVSTSISEHLSGLPSGVQQLLPLFTLTWLVFVVLMAILMVLQRTPWGRVLRAIRDDEDAARALGKNTLLYKLQSIGLAAAIGAVAGYILALYLAVLDPGDFVNYTFIGYAVLVLGGLGTYVGIPAGAVVFFALYEGTRYLDLPLSADQIAALRFMLVGLVLILLMVFRPQGLLGKREEMRLR
jgi:branched-chain amino acid transport system permease protein